MANELYQTINLTRKSIGESNDCTVVSLAVIAEISYHLAHRIASKAGRQSNQGFWTEKIVPVAAKHGILFSSTRRYFGDTLEDFLKANPIGRFIVETADHALPVINGRALDSTFKSTRLEMVFVLIEDDDL
jgi:hypothetical protein